MASILTPRRFALEVSSSTPVPGGALAHIFPLSRSPCLYTYPSTVSWVQGPGPPQTGASRRPGEGDREIPTSPEIRAPPNKTPKLVHLRAPLSECTKEPGGRFPFPAPGSTPRGLPGFCRSLTCLYGVQREAGGTPRRLLRGGIGRFPPYERA